MKRILIVILALLVWMAAAAAESAGEDAMLVHLAEGEMTVRDAEGNILASEADMSVFSGYSIETGDDSYAYIYLDDGKTVKLDMNTLVTVSRSGGKALVELKSGQLAFFLTAPLGEDGEFLIRAGELETSVLGSSGVVALRKVVYATGHGIIYQADENGMLPKSFEIWGGQLLEPGGGQIGTRVESAQVSDLPSVYLKEVEQNEILQQSLQREGNYDVDELIAMVPVAEAAEQAAREEAAAAVVQPPSDDAATNPAFTKDDEPINPVVPVVPDFETVTVIWKNGTEKLAEELVVKGSAPKYSGSEPTRAADAQYTYTFIGWDHEEKQVYEDTVYYAEFKSTLRKYTIIWENDDGSVIDTMTLEYGATPEHAAAAKEATAQYIYTFAGWDPAVTEVAGDATYTATYSEAARTYYTITWTQDDGTVIDSATVAYGATPEHAAPEKAATAQYTYTFTGWDPAVTAVAGDATYKAVYDATVRTYTITWKDDGDNVIETSTLEYGATPEHAAPEKAATAEYTYTFTGWDPAVATVAGDAAYKAVYSEAARTYTITWTQDDGAVIDSATVAYGATPEHAAPEKAATDKSIFTFTGWDPAVTMVAGDATYKAVYSEAARTYTITWTQDDGTLIDTTTVEYGATPEHANAAKAATAEAYYTFAGWEPAVAAVTGDATYKASYTSQPAYTITWMNWNETVFDVQYLPAGVTPSHAGPAMTDPEEGYVYTFSGWEPVPYPVSGNEYYYPQYLKVEEGGVVPGSGGGDEGGVSGSGQ